MPGEKAPVHPLTHMTVALVARGGCMFEDKARNVQLAGDTLITTFSTPASMRISVQAT